MKKRASSIAAILLCLLMVFSFASCTDDVVEEEEFVAATLDITDDVPVSETEIIAFYNDVIAKIQADDVFTAENKPGLNYSESIGAGNLNILAYNEAGEAVEDGKLSALNSSANALKNRIIGGVPTDSGIIAFGDTATSFADALNAGEDVYALTADDVVSAECHVDGSKLYIAIKLAGNEATVANVFGTRVKADVLAGINEYSKDYAEVTGYTVTYVEDAENNTYSTINLEVEVAKQEDGTFKCTGRVMNLNINVICDVAADVTCKGSFADNGNIQVNFRFTDSKNYSFDWMGTESWEPVAEAASTAE